MKSFIEEYVGILIYRMVQHFWMESARVEFDCRVKSRDLHTLGVCVEIFSMQILGCLVMKTPYFTLVEQLLILCYIIICYIIIMCIRVNPHIEGSERCFFALRSRLKICV